jgi:hypothetical protein
MPGGREDDPVLWRLRHLGLYPLSGAHPPRRYGPAQRWPGVLRRELGDGFWIVERA